MIRREARLRAVVISIHFKFNKIRQLQRLPIHIYGYDMDRIWVYIWVYMDIDMDRIYMDMGMVNSRY